MDLRKVSALAVERSACDKAVGMTMSKTRGGDVAEDARLGGREGDGPWRRRSGQVVNVLLQ